MRSTFLQVIIASTVAALLAAGCGDDKTGAGASAARTAAPAGAGHGGAVIDLGDATIGGFQAHATRDEGAIVAGKDAPIDVTVKPTDGSTARPIAVRFWIGLEDAKVSVKAKAAIENPAEADRWHTHAEIPDPLPTGSRLWVEIEGTPGQLVTGSFDLKG